MKGSAIRVVLAVALFSAVSAQAAPVLSTWDDATMDGWTAANNSWGRWEVSATGGNPGGYVRFFDLNSTYTADTLHAPASYLGDYQPLLANGWIEWDMLSGKTAAIGTTLTLVGPGGRAFHTSPVPGAAWSHVKVELKPQYWTVSQGTWAGLMANITDLNLVGDVASGDGTVELSLDNFALVPEPASVALLALAAGGVMRRRARR